MFGYNDAQVVNAFKEKVQALEGFDSFSRARFVERELRDMGMDASIQLFNVTDNSEKRWGANAYAVFRAPRGDGTEGVVISAPWECMDGSYNLNGVSLLLGFARFAAKYSYWAKDLIFVVNDRRVVGTKAWLQAYHGEAAPSWEALQYESLKTHGGAIQEAINLEFGGGPQDYSHVGLYVEGLNGQQSNADLITVTARMLSWSGIPTTLHHDSLDEGHIRTEWDAYVASAKRLATYIKYQALGFPVAGHALYPRYKIEAVTMVGQRTHNTYYSVGTQRIELLHHSFWFYVMPSPHAFLLLSVYIPPVVLLSAPLVLQALSLWWKSGGYLGKSKPGPSEIVNPTTHKDATLLLARPASIPSSFSRLARPLFEPVFVAALKFALGASLVVFLPEVRFDDKYTLRMRVGKAQLGDKVREF
ncbi:Glycosyl phosphatidyl inositol protein transamidase complex subunit [Quaeritorhiza haematococci]|nr:Glycosyl phosphatidyl inositol protein transamidase complex subunit [Quaeritorhiza haematococci]